MAMRIFPEGDNAMAVMFIRLSNGSVSIFALTHAEHRWHGAPLYIYSVALKNTAIIMVALWNRADHYIFILLFVLISSFFFFLA